MAQKFPISIWNYRPIDELTPEEVDVWAECGLTVPMSPRLEYGKDDMRKLLPFLDRAAEKGIQLIAYIDPMEYNGVTELGEEEYRRRFKEIYGIIKHPALYGFYIGDEPGTKQNFEECVAAVRIQMEEAPELSPYLNLHTCMDDTDPSLLGGKHFRQWLKDFAEETGFHVFSYGHYDQVVDEEGIDSCFRNLKALVAAAEQAGVDCWNTQLSSPHYMFRIPNYYELLWQITVPAACGSRGVNWFRFYDRSIAPNYHYSPIDEYGNRTPVFYDMLRANRRFNDHYGELIMSLRHKATYFTRKTYGGYDIFTDQKHPIIKDVISTEQAVVSFFEDAKGTEYLCLVNNSMEKAGVFRPVFDREKYSLVELIQNGRIESVYQAGKTMAHWDGQWLYPAQMCIFRIDKIGMEDTEIVRQIWSH